jgi:carbon monoxide dehydrogenase subunit G
MKLENRFTVPVPVDQAWQVLLDVQRIAPCVPGATLTSNLTYGGKASFVSEGDATQVEVDTELTVTGKPAQFGRGVLADVSGKLVDQFAACLSEELQAGGSPEPVFAATAAALGTPEGVEPVAAPVAAPVADRPSAEAIDLLGTAGGPVLKRLLPALAGLAVLALIVRRLRRR